jgi:hypothetical protein
MRTLQKWSVILLFVVGIFGCAQKPTSGFKPNSEPDGFAGIKWGTPFSEVKSDMVELRSISDPAEPDVKIKIYYTQKGDHLKVGSLFHSMKDTAKIKIIPPWIPWSRQPHSKFDLNRRAWR